MPTLVGLRTGPKITGHFPVPFRHGMTPGEVQRVLKEQHAENRVQVRTARAGPKRDAPHEMVAERGEVLHRANGDELTGKIPDRGALERKGLARRTRTLALTRGGAIRVVEAIPTYFDFRAPAGESFTIHDLAPPTSVRVQFDGKCAEGGIVELDRDTRFRTPKISGGKDAKVTELECRALGDARCVMKATWK